MELYEIARRKMQDNFSNEYDENTLLKNYDSYIETLLSFEGNKNNIIEILTMYREILCDYIKSNYIIKEKIMFKDKCFRNDLDFDE